MPPCTVLKDVKLSVELAPSSPFLGCLLIILADCMIFPLSFLNVIKLYFPIIFHLLKLNNEIF